MTQLGSAGYSWQAVGNQGWRDEVLTAEEVAALLKVGKPTVYRLASSPGTEGLPARKVGREWRFLQSEILNWLRQNPAPGRS